MSQNFSIDSILAPTNNNHELPESPRQQGKEEKNENVEVPFDPKELDDNQDPNRPRYTYPALIAMAINNSPSKRLTLDEIYNYLMAKFPYFANCKVGWKNIVRHNLSVHNSFVKIPRSYGEEGRGCYWALSSEVKYIGADTGKLRPLDYPQLPSWPAPPPYPNAVVQIQPNGIPPQGVMVPNNWLHYQYYLHFHQQYLLQQTNVPYQPPECLDSRSRR